MVEIKARAGDLVKLRLAREEMEGTLLESYDSSVLLVKLKSGYNIGILKASVFDCRVIKKYEKKENVKDKGVKNEKRNLPLIGLVITGGTIASKLDARTGGVNALTSTSEFKRFYPGLFDMVDVSIEAPFMLDSGSIGPDHWFQIATSVKKLINDKEVAGVVVAHGTDTLHYTSSALSFFLRDLGKPVVLTYAQRSIDRASSDAELNLKCAAKFALSNVAGVYVVGHADLNDNYCHALLGTKVRKLHTSRRDAFKAVNIGAIAKVWPDKVEFLSNFKARHDKSVELDAVFNDKVALLKFYPGQNPDILDYHVKEGYKGVVIEMLGLGQIAGPDVKNNWIPVIKKCIKQGMIICGAAQTIFGRLDAKVYSTGRELEKAGVIFLDDMLSECAFVKLGWVLGHKGFKGIEKVKEKMLENVSGEFNDLLTE